MQPVKLLHRIIPAFAIVAVIAAGAPPARAWTETVLHSFAGGSDGSDPEGNVIADASGNLYGTTVFGGGGCFQGVQGRGCGTVYKLAPDGTETVLHAFTHGGDGGWPYGGLVEDSEGNLFGTTSSGGGHRCGTIFEVTQSGVETVLHRFQGSDGCQPVAGLISDRRGNLYGTASGGGTCSSNDCGTVFKLTPAGHYKVLHSFKGGSDGLDPRAPLMLDRAGNLYGTTIAGGGAGACPDSCGTVFELAPDSTETILYAFRGGRDGVAPIGGLAFDTGGNLYGTTASGGCRQNACGTVFEIAPDGVETVLARFDRTRGPTHPIGGVVVDKHDNLFGTSEGGGSVNCGTVFKIAPGQHPKVLHAFNCGSDGRSPVAGLLRGSDRRLYGTTINGGAFNNGTVFVLQK